MHPSSYENMERCYSEFLIRAAFHANVTVNVLDVGGSDFNGSYRSIFPTDRFTYRIFDPGDETGLSPTFEDPYTIPMADKSVDIVISGQAFEHIPQFWRTFSEMVLNRTGFAGGSKT